jgi:hypothetical protein
LLEIIGIHRQLFVKWKRFYGQEIKREVKRKENWALESEIKLVIEYKRSNMEEGYRRLSYQLIDLDIVYLARHKN